MVQPASGPFMGGSQTGTLETGTLSCSAKKSSVFPPFLLLSGGVLGTFHGFSKYPFAKYPFASL